MYLIGAPSHGTVLNDYSRSMKFEITAIIAVEDLCKEDQMLSQMSDRIII